MNCGNGATSPLPSVTWRAGTRFATLIIRAVSGVRTSLSSGILIVKHRAGFACSKKALEHLQVYEEIHCYLDNDLAGQKTEETIAGMYGKRVHNEALRYHEYKDLNDYLRGKKR